MFGVWEGSLFMLFLRPFFVLQEFFRFVLEFFLFLRFFL